MFLLRAQLIEMWDAIYKDGTVFMFHVKRPCPRRWPLTSGVSTTGWPQGGLECLVPVGRKLRRDHAACEGCLRVEQQGNAGLAHRIFIAAAKLGLESQGSTWRRGARRAGATRLQKGETAAEQLSSWLSCRTAARIAEAHVASRWPRSAA